MNAAIKPLQESFIHTPTFIVAKMNWKENAKIIETRKERESFFTAQEDHYVLIYQYSKHKAFCWEPSFSGELKSPLFEIDWELLVESNSKIYFKNERGKAIYINS